MAEPEPPNGTPPGVEPGKAEAWEIALQDLRDRIAALDAQRGSTSFTASDYNFRTVLTKICSLEHCITHILVSLRMIEVMMGMLLTPYSWEQWAKDTDPESDKAAADLAASVGVGLDRILGKWKA